MTHVLIIDDEAMIRDVLTQALTERGFQISSAANGREGFELCCREPPQIIITDLLMPDGEGLEAIRRLKREFPSIRIIAISGGYRSGNIDLLETAATMGADRTFAKPVSLRRLITAIEELTPPQEGGQLSATRPTKS